MGIKRKFISSIWLVQSINTTAELAQVISEEAPEAIKTGEIKNHFGRKVAIVS